MIEEESCNRKIMQVRSCIVPTETVKMVNLDLGPDENGIVIDYEIKTDKYSKKENEYSLFYDTKIVPITIRKYLLYMQSRAG